MTEPATDPPEEIAIDISGQIESNPDGTEPEAFVMIEIPGAIFRIPHDDAWKLGSWMTHNSAKLKPGETLKIPFAPGGLRRYTAPYVGSWMIDAAATVRRDLSLYRYLTGAGWEPGEVYKLLLALIDAADPMPDMNTPPANWPEPNS